MSKKDAPTPPTPVDPVAVANAQTKSNIATSQYQSQLNNTNVNGPYGTIGYTQDPTSHQWTQTTQLIPAEQAIFNQTTANQNKAVGIAGNQLTNVQNALNTPIAPTGPLADHVGTGQIQQQIGPSDFNQAVKSAQDAAYNQATSRLDPQWAQNTEHQNAQLVAQGLNPNDAAYQNSQQLFNQSKNDAYNQANYSAVNAGNAEQNLLFGQQAAQGQFANQAQQQGATQGFQNADLYNQANQQQFTNSAYAQAAPINEFNSLMSSGQVQPPQSANGNTPVAPTDVTGAYALNAQQQQANYQSQLANYQSGLGGLFGLGSAAITGAFGLSDARLKTDIRYTGRSLGGFRLYDYRFHGDPTPRRGVMAQEVAMRRPDLVATHPSGYLMVDYARLV